MPDRGGQIALPWSATTKLSLDILCGKFEPLEMIQMDRSVKRPDRPEDSHR